MSVDFQGDKEVSGNAFDAPKSPTEDSNRSSFSPLEWQVVVNKIYNSGKVTITLPARSSVGDV